jgi:phage tail sheath protein FI
LCAYTDKVTNQAHSIAGLNRGLLPVLKQRYTYDDGQATALYNAQVNYVRTFVGQGIALWEQQTLANQQSALSWLNVRRCVNAIKVALYQYLLYSLQEQDTDALRRSIRNGLSSYLDTWVNAEGISSYQVVCDKSNNPAAAVNAAVLVVTVIIVPTLAVHEIQLQVVISKAGVSFAEVLNQVTGNTP